MTKENEMEIKEVQTVFQIPERNMEELTMRLTKLNRIATKLNTTPITMKVTGEKMTEHKPETGLSYMVKVFTVVVTGTAPVINGWTFAATLQHEDGKNILRVAPVFEKTLPVMYRTRDAICDHCGYNRLRRDTYIVFNEAKNEYKQVGRQCLRDFLGHESPQAIARWSEYIFDIGSAIGDLEDDAHEFADCRLRSVEYFKMEEFLEIAASVIRRYGWVSRNKSTLQNPPTAERLNEWYFNKHLPDIMMTEDDKKLARDARQWAMEIPETTDNDYMWNLRSLANSEAIQSRSFGYAASMIAAYQREMERKMKSANSTFFGTVGKREVFTLKFISARESNGYYGPVSIITFVDKDGNAAVWYASGDFSAVMTGLEFHYEGFDRDTFYEVKATVKTHHTNRDGVNETVINRMKMSKKGQKNMTSDENYKPTTV
jgi:hypothetical protein